MNCDRCVHHSGGEHRLCTYEDKAREFEKQVSSIEVPEAIMFDHRSIKCKYFAPKYAKKSNDGGALKGTQIRDAIAKVSEEKTE